MENIYPWERLIFWILFPKNSYEILGWFLKFGIYLNTSVTNATNFFSLILYQLNLCDFQDSFLKLWNINPELENEKKFHEHFSHVYLEKENILDIPETLIFWISFPNLN